MMWLVFLLVLLSPSLVNAACGGSSPNLTAASGSKADIDDCVTAAIDGDTITIPGGTVTLAGLVTITNKSITLTGVAAGTLEQCAAGGQTQYTCLQRAGKILDWSVKTTGGSPAGQTILKNITFITLASTSDCATYSAAGVSLFGTTTAMRVTNNHFITTDNTCGSLVVRQNITGVIDHNTFTSRNVLSHAIVVTHSSWLGVGTNGDNSWAQADTLGTDKNVFIEDNTFQSTLADNSYNTYSDHFLGARVVTRFNTITGGSFHSHGTESGGRWRGPRHREDYGNTFTWNGTSNVPVIVLRGTGTARVFDNTLTTTNSTSTAVADTNVYRGTPGTAHGPFYPWGGCQKLSVTLSRSGTTVTGTTTSEHWVAASGSYIAITGAGAPFDGTAIEADRVSSTQFTYTVADSGATSSSGTVQGAFDGNTDNYGYPCLDQPGRGTGNYISGDLVLGSSSITGAGPINQAAAPYYAWNNTDDGTVKSLQPSQGVNVIVENRDYYNYNASFNGTVGMGRGVRASRPATCTTNTAYWSTDGGTNWNTTNGAGVDGGLDICTSTNTWTNDSYVPYTYPHDFNDGGSGLPPAEAPTRFAPSINLRRVDAGELAMVGE